MQAIISLMDPILEYSLTRQSDGADLDSNRYSVDDPSGNDMPDIGGEVENLLLNFIADHTAESDLGQALSGVRNSAPGIWSFTLTDSDTGDTLLAEFMITDDYSNATDVYDGDVQHVLSRYQRTPSAPVTPAKWSCNHKREEGDESCPICEAFGRPRVTSRRRASVGWFRLS